MSDEKWNRFASTGSVRDYLEYRACFSYEEPECGRMVMKKEGNSFEQVGAVKVLNSYERGIETWGRPSF